MTDPTDVGATLCRCGDAKCRKAHATRALITHVGTVAADEQFAHGDDADAFVAWFLNQPDLPKVGALTMRADMCGDLLSRGAPTALVPHVRERFVSAMTGAEMVHD